MSTTLFNVCYYLSLLLHRSIKIRVIIKFKEKKMNNKRIIKKYPNRRLYDTEDSIYITLENIRELVIKNKEFIVKDVKTDEDLTKNTLLQIIIEREGNSGPLFSAETLAHIVRFYEDSIKSIAGDYLQESISQFALKENNAQHHIETNTIENLINDN